VKYRFSLFLTSLVLSASALQAQDYSTSDLNPVQETNLAESNTTPQPCQFESSYNYIGRAKFDKHCLRHQHIRYSNGTTQASCVFYYNPCYQEGLAGTVGYTYTMVDWNRNPFFHQKHFNQATFGIAAFTHRLCDWLWRSQVSINMNTDHFNFSYSTYDLLLWGRWDYREDIGLHIGLLAFTGIRIDRVYPILGFDWQYSCNLKFNVIFPLDISAVYTFNDSWSVAVAGRPFFSRYRLGRHAHPHKGVFEYTNGGVELALNYQYNEWLHANVHVGDAFGGRLKVANSRNHNSKRFRFNSAGYIGGEVDISF
jgi:hypothetical protein